METENNGRLERFWLWLRLNLYTEGTSRAVHALGSRQQGMLAELEGMRKELTAIRAAVGDTRRELGMPPGVEMEDIDVMRPLSGDPTGL